MYAFIRTRPFFMVTLLVVFGLAAFIASAQDGRRPTSYTIEPRDTLDGIAQSLDVSIVSLLQANGITRSTILRPGEILTIPADAPPYGAYPAIESLDLTAGQGGGVAGDLYVVQPRDTLDTIGQRLNVSVVALMDANGIKKGRSLMAGMTIVIPDDAPPYGTYPARRAADGAVGDTSLGQGGGAVGDEYVVQPNDTLDRIAARHNLQTQCLAEKNNMKKPGRIYAGDVIIIDTSCPVYDGYDVVGTPEPAPSGSG